MAEEKKEEGRAPRLPTKERVPYFRPEVISEQELTQDVLLSESK
tara:strand:+ start:360 stop:491 length:132 start_codon:yes stop_codon:yes gene_type:complete